MKTTRRSSRWTPRVDGLEERRLMAAPVLDPINGLSAAGELSLPAGKSRIVPLTANDADGDAITYTAASDQAGVKATILTGGPILKLSVAGKGDMIFQLLPNFAPNTVNTIVGLVNSGFYNGLKIHRVVPNFVIQGGDPNGDGSGGPGFSFDDEFNPQAIFSGNGHLAMANSGKDTNGSQFFVTLGAQRFLDFNHTIYGQLLRGFDVLSDIDDDPNSGSPRNAPTTPIVITSATIISDTSDAVLLLQSTSTISANITIAASDGTPGGQATAQFKAAVAADATNDPAILGPVANQVTATNTPITFRLTGTDVENNALTYAVDSLDNPTNASITVSGDTVTVTPTAGFRGDLHLKAKVKQADAMVRGSSTDPYDTQAFTVTVKDRTLTATGLNAAGQSGSSFTAKVAHLTSDLAVTAGTFAATIDWGDGTSSAGLIQGSNGQFDVVGTKTYFRAGTYSVAVAIREGASGVTASATSQAAIADSPLAAVFSSPPVIPGTAQVIGTIAQFSNTNTATNLGDLLATIDWGDGTTSSGTIAGGNGKYTVFGSKTFSGLGTYNVQVVIQSLGGASAVAVGTIVVPNRVPVLAAIPNQTIQAGSTLSLVAAATDADPDQVIHYSLAPGAPAGATIDPTTGAFSWTPKTGPTTAAITVVATDSGSPSQSSSRTFTVTVRYEAPIVKVLSAFLLKKKRQIKTIRLNFSGDVNASALGPFSDVALVSAGKDRKIGTRDDVIVRFRSTSYDAATRTLSLVPKKKLAAKGVYRLRANGLADTSGRAVDLDGDGVAGDAFLTFSGKNGAIL